MQNPLPHNTYRTIVGMCCVILYFFHFIFTDCEFPEEWLGEWNLEGERDSLHISIEDFGTKGFCLKHEDGTYIIYNRYFKC